MYYVAINGCNVQNKVECCVQPASVTAGASGRLCYNTVLWGTTHPDLPSSQDHSHDSCQVGSTLRVLPVTSD